MKEIAPDPDELATILARIERLGTDHGIGTHTSAINGYLLGRFSGLITEAAQDHGRTCVGCEICEFLARGLAVVSACHMNMPEIAGDDFWDR